MFVVNSLYNSQKLSGGLFFMRVKFFISLFILNIMCVSACAAPRIITHGEPHVGEPVVLSVNESDIPSGGSVEWSITPTTGLNPARIALRAGGRECSFIPLDVKPVRVTAIVSDRNGSAAGNSEYMVVPKEFSIKISVVVDKPLTLWDSDKRSDYVLEPGVLSANSPIRIRANLQPASNIEHSFKWNSDAATALLSPDKDDIFILRGQTGDSEISVTAFNSMGTKLGSGASVVKISLPVSKIEQSNREREAWQSWQKAQELWNSQNYTQAVAFGNKALSLSPRDKDITAGLKVMTLNYSRYTRAQKLRESAVALDAKGSYDEALKNLRVAQIIWPVDRGEADIKKEEERVNELRILQQKANWLRDTASAYDNEQMFEDALDYYARSIAVMSSDAIVQRMDKIKTRLVKMTDADKYAGEGNKLEREGKLHEAINHYTASIMSNPDAGLKQHVDELQNVLRRREDQARVLAREAKQLERKNPQEALKRYKESLNLWDDGRVEQQINLIERNTKLDNGTKLRDAEDFGIGTRNDAAKIIQDADKLYSEGKLKEAVELYQKAQKISSSKEIAEWLSRIEKVIAESDSVNESNALIKQANALYKSGKTKEAIDLYKKSLTVHPNAQLQKFIEKNSK